MFSPFDLVEKEAPMSSLILTLAHEGHDHSATLGGQWHHVLWLAVAVIAIGFGIRAVARRMKNAECRNEDDKPAK